MTDPQPTHSTLLQLAESLRKKMVKVQNAEASKHTLELWRPLSENLPEYREQLKALVGAMLLMQSHGLLPGGRIGSLQLSKLLKQLGELRECLLQHPEKVMQKSRWAKTEVEIKGAANTLEKNLMTAWRAYLASIAPMLDDWLPFFQVNRFGPQLSNIKTLRGELNALADTLPTDEEVLQRAQLKGRQLHELVKQLDFGDIPPAVQAFLKRTLDSFTGATLADLDPEVLSWLREKKLTHAFRISMGGR